ncbi:MAG: hypothetical protein ACREBA_02220 [Nitrosotalea sp.]
MHSTIDSITKKLDAIVCRFFKRFTRFVDQNRSRLWIILAGLYVIPYILAVVGSALFPSNNIFVILAMIATSEGLGTLSNAIRKWGQKPKSKPRKKSSKGKGGNANNDVLSRHTM